MNKKLILATLMVSAMGFSSLFAEEEVPVSIDQELSCDKCGNLEEDILDKAKREKPEELSSGDKTEQVKDDEFLSCDCDKHLSSEDDEAV